MNFIILIKNFDYIHVKRTRLRVKLTAELKETPIFLIVPMFMTKV